METTTVADLPLVLEHHALQSSVSTSTTPSSELASAGQYVENANDFVRKLPGLNTWQPE